MKRYSTPILVILILIIVTLVSYKFINQKKEELNNEEEIVTTYEEWESLAPFPENDSSVKSLVLSYDGMLCEEYDYCSEIDLSYNNKLNYTVNGFKIEFNCLKYQKDEDEDFNYCSKNQLKIDSKVNYEFINNIEFEDVKTLIFKTPKYYIIKQANSLYGQGDFKIFDLNGKLVKSINKSITEFDLFPEDIDDEMQSVMYDPTISDNKLYYVYTDYLNFENGLDNKVHLGYIDLNNNFKYTESFSIKAITSLGI